MLTPPLAGVRVLTIDNYLAGNYGPQLLAMHGAEVVKIELERGDVMRSSAPFVERADGGEWSHGELRLMRGKASIVLDPNDDGDRELLGALIDAADVVWTNLLPSSAERVGVDWPSVQARNPSAVYASVTGFGLPGNGVGEFGAVAAFDLLIQGVAGLMARNADQSGEPVYNGIPIADQVASLYGTFGVLLALLQRNRTGVGCCVDVAMFDAMVALNEKAVTMYGLTGEVPPPRASATTAPFDRYRTREGWVCIAVGSDIVWRRFCEAIGRPELTNDPRVDTAKKRVDGRDTILRTIVEEWTTQRTVNDVIAALQAFKVPAGPAVDVDQLIDTRQVRERGIIDALEIDADRSFPIVMSPVILSDTPRPKPEPPHELGVDRERIIAAWLGRTAG